MSEVVIENVEEVAVKKKWKASTVRIAFAIFILIPFVAVWAGMTNIDTLVWIDFLFFFGLAMYGKISGKLETDNSKKSALTNAGRLGYDDFGVPGAPLSRY